jgi:uncharacterized protein
MYEVTWVIKASKLCNLRCLYCYEWDELGNPARIALSDWTTLLVAIRDYQHLTAQRLARPVRSLIVWHGGEPLLLPSAYVRSVLALEREILGPESLASGEFVNCIQTNLYSLTADKLDLLKEGRFNVGVSMDLVGGVRLTARGRETETAVAGNIDRLRSTGIEVGAIVVLAAHTAPHLRRIHDAWEALGVSYRVLPLFPSPLNVPGTSFGLSTRRILEALEDLFVHWLERGCPIPVDPLNRYLENVLMHRCGLDRERWSRRAYGDAVLVVNTDGNLYQVVDAYQADLALGNVFHQPVESILAGRPFHGSLDRSDELVARHCPSCPYHGPCNTAPLFEQRPAPDASGHCSIARPLHDFIDRHLHATGFDTAALEALLIEPAGPSRPVAS